MSKELEQRVDRLEAWAARTFGITLAEFDSAEQAADRAKTDEDNRKTGERAQQAAAKELEA